MVELHPDLLDLLGALAASNAEYLIVGGWAVSFHSEPRYTKDLDLLIGHDDANLVRVVSALETFGAPRTILDKARTLQPEEFLFFGVAPARVDVLRTIPGVGFRDAYARRVVAEWGGTPVSIIGRDDLLDAKKAAGRERDLRDLRALEKSRPPRS